MNNKHNLKRKFESNEFYTVLIRASQKEGVNAPALPRTTLVKVNKCVPTSLISKAAIQAIKKDHKLKNMSAYEFEAWLNNRQLPIKPAKSEQCFLASSASHGFVI